MAKRKKEKEEVTQEGPDLASLLAAFEGSPSKEQLETWKQEHGEVFCSGFSETELFVFRPLTWLEHKQLNKELSAPVEQGEEPATEFDLQERVVDLCLLWTSVQRFEQKGGTIPTLFEQVMMQSNFVSPQLAAAFVVKL